MMQSSALTPYLQKCSSSSGCSVHVKSTDLRLNLDKPPNQSSESAAAKQMLPFSASNLVTLENSPRSGTANYRGTTTRTRIQILSEERSIKSLCRMVPTMPDLGALSPYSEGSRLEAAIVTYAVGCMLEKKPR